MCRTVFKFLKKKERKRERDGTRLKQTVFNSGRLGERGGGRGKGEGGGERKGYRM